MQASTTDIVLLKYIYQYVKLQIKIADDSTTNVISMQKGVRQEDTIPAKFFTLGFGDVFKQLDCDRMFTNIDGRYLNQLRFADDIRDINEI